MTMHATTTDTITNDNDIIAHVIFLAEHNSRNIHLRILR